MNTILITGGELPQYSYVSHLFEDAYVCVADSGFDWVLKNNVRFDVLVGDMDSVKSISELEDVDKSKIKKFPCDKDDTDTMIGLRHLKEIGSDTITLVGGGGGRLDHLLGIFSLFESDLSPDVWYTHNEVVFRVDSRFELDEFYQEDISIYPIGKVRCSIDSYGLKWELIKVDWKYKSIGISNHVNKTRAWIDPADNVLLLIAPLAGKGFEERKN